MATFRKKFDDLEMTRPGQKFFPQETNLHIEQRWIYELCVLPRTLEVLQELLGPDIVLLSSTLLQYVE